MRPADAGNGNGARPTVVRPPHIAETVAIVDGVPGCGKTLLSRVVESLDRVELQKFNFGVEYACSLRFLGAIEDDAAQVMVRMLTDLDLYNVMQSREINFRPSDLSAAWKSPRRLDYVRRLVRPGDAAAVERIRKERPILHIVTHSLLPMIGPAASALGPRLRLIEVVRHPLYMLRQWRLYIERYGSDPRDFTIWFQSAGRALPWWAYGWEERYLASNPMDRVIYAIENLLSLVSGGMEAVSASGGSVLVVPFERFVKSPDDTIAGLERLLGTQVRPATRRVLRRANVPRTMVADGADIKIYRQNGWEPPRRGSSEAAELAVRRAYAAAEASPDALAILDRMSEEYESRYDLARFVRLRD